MVTQIRAAEIAANIASLNHKISLITPKQCLLLAVSKTKPVQDLMEAYEAGQRHFGENFVDEFVEKAAQLPQDFKWHFVGHIQTNKVKKLISVNNIYLIESVDSIKLAAKLQKEMEKTDKQGLGILVQLQSGDEDTKSGLPISELDQMLSFIQMECPRLRFRGFMAMGKLSDRTGFKQMKEIYDRVQAQQPTGSEPLVLSMGTSMDFEMAIEEGATEVRLGSTIFGERNFAKK